MKQLWSKPLSWHSFGWLVVATIILAAGLRLFKLGQIPAGMTWDEAAIAYNGFAVWDSYRDEWLRLLPVSFQSFGDFKAPAAIYLSGLFVWLFGSELWILRLPFALAGVVSVGSFVWLTFQVARYFKYSVAAAQRLALLAGFGLAFSPWHIHFTRAGFESGLALAGVIMGMALAFNWLQHNRFWAGLLAVIFLDASLYAYHATKLFLPVLGIVLVFWLWPQLKNRVRQLSILAGVGLVGLLPLLRSTFFGSGAERANQTSLLALEGSLFEKIWTMLVNFAAHLSPTFLVFGQTTTLRHGDGHWGVLFPTTFGLMVLGLGFLWLHRRKKSAQSNQTTNGFGWLALWWILAGLAAPAIGLEVPHSNRALLALPGFLWLAVWGLDQALTSLKSTSFNQVAVGSHGEKELVLKTVVGMLLLLHSLYFVSYWHEYQTTYAAESGAAFNDQYLEAVEVAISYEGQVSEIIFSDKYGQPYIYTLLKKRANPFEYRHYGALHPYQFRGVTPQDLSKTDALLVATPQDEIDHSQADRVLYGADGSPRFYIFEPKQL